MTRYDYEKHPSNDPLKSLLHNLVRYPFRWLIPAAAVITVACVFAAHHRDRWEANQAVLVRGDASSDSDGSGEFRNSDEMKRVEETILEVARSTPVLEASLLQVGPDPSVEGDEEEGEWPSKSAINRFRKDVQIEPPKGAEFGRTEIFYVKLRAYQPERAVALADAVCRNLQVEFDRVREARLRGTIAELQAKLKLADEELADATEHLAEIESAAGQDLALLRMLEKSTTGHAELTSSVSIAEANLRALRSDHQIKLQLLEQLRNARDHADPLDVIPNETFDYLPELKRLKEALTETELELAQMSGNWTDKYPLVVAAGGRVDEVRAMISETIESAIRSLQAETQFVDSRAEIMENNIAGLKERLQGITRIRAEYSNWLSRVVNAQNLVAETQRRMTSAVGHQVAVANANLINPMGEPECSTGPVGPSQVEIIVVGIAGGLLTGLGFLVLTAPFGVPSYHSIPLEADLQRAQLAASANYIEYQQPAGTGQGSAQASEDVQPNGSANGRNHDSSEAGKETSPRRERVAHAK